MEALATELVTRICWERTVPMSQGIRVPGAEARVKREMELMGKRCGKRDVFVFFYSGHGLNVPDLDGDESDGEDEAFAMPDK